MKLLLVGPDPYHPGGIQKVFGAMLAYLGSIPGLDAHSINENIAKRRPLAESSTPFDLMRGSLHLMNSFRAKLATIRPDVVHLNAAYGRSILEKAMMARIASRRGVPTVIHMHGSRMDVEFPIMGSFRRTFLHGAFSPPNHAVVLSERSRAVFLDRFPGLPTTVLPNAVDAVSDPPSPRAEPRHLGFLGALQGRKGELDLIQALAVIDPSIDLVVAGDGPGRGGAEGLARSLGIEDRVRFLGNIDGASKADFFRSIDALCLPSHAENFPVALLEAMAWGLPVISTTVAGIPEMVQDGAQGWLVPPGQLDALAIAIREAFRDPDELRRRGRLARERVEARYTWDVIGPRWVELYRSLMIGRAALTGWGA